MIFGLSIRAYVEYQAFSSLIRNSFQVQVSNMIFHVQAFQVLVCTPTKLRTSLKVDMILVLCFLRAHFLKQLQPKNE